MFWKVCRKDNGLVLDKVWFTLAMSATDVYDQLEVEFDFEILVSPDCED